MDGHQGSTELVAPVAPPLGLSDLMIFCFWLVAENIRLFTVNVRLFTINVRLFRVGHSL